MRFLTKAYERLLWWRALPAFIGHLYERIENVEARLAEFDGGGEELTVDQEHRGLS